MNKDMLRIFLGIVIALFITAFALFQKPVDLRPLALKDGISLQQVEQGKALLKEIQNAYGGKHRPNTLNGSILP